MDDTQNCYTRLPNSVLAWLYGPEHDLTFRQVRVLMVVFRHTYGFSRRSAMLSSRFVADATGIDQGDCVRVLKSLVEARLLEVSYERKIGFYTLCPRRYKNKRIQAPSYADDGDSPSRWCFTPETDGDLPSKKEINKGAFPSPDLSLDDPSASDESPSRGYGLKNDLGGEFYGPNVSGEYSGTPDACGDDWEALRGLAEATPGSLLGELLADAPEQPCLPTQPGPDDNDSQEDPLEWLF